MTFFGGAGMICLEARVDLHLALPGITFGLATLLGITTLLAGVLSLSSTFVRLVLDGPRIFLTSLNAQHFRKTSSKSHLSTMSW